MTHLHNIFRISGLVLHYRSDLNGFGDEIDFGDAISSASLKMVSVSG